VRAYQRQARHGGVKSGVVISAMQHYRRFALWPKPHTASKFNRGDLTATR
jgi:hypothetical protein